MFKNVKIWIYAGLALLLLAILLLLLKTCQPAAKAPHVVPTVTAPGSVTTAPTQEEEDAMKRLQGYEKDYPDKVLR